MSSFGQLLRSFRQKCRDPMRGGLLSQDRLGELLGLEMGSTGYSAAAVSYWERDKSKIHVDDRLQLVSLVAVLHRCGGLATPAEADRLLQAGNYRALNPAELQQAFPDFPTERAEEGRRSQAGPTPVEDTPGQQADRVRRKQLLLLGKVKSFWVEGVLEQSVQGAALIRLDQKRADKGVAQPWDDVLGPEMQSVPEHAETHSTLELFLANDRALLILGDPGAGKSTTLISLARDLAERAEMDRSEPIPVLLNLVSWAEHQPSLARWIVEELTAKYLIPRHLGREWLEKDELTLLLDGFDEVPASHRRWCAAEINAFREAQGLTGMVVCSRTEEFEETGVPLKLGGAILIQPLTTVQIDDYLAAAGLQPGGLRAAVKDDAMLREMAQSPLMLSVISQAYGDQDTVPGATAPAGRDLSAPVISRRRLFDSYVQRMFGRRVADSAFPREDTTRWLAWLAHQMFRHNRSTFLLEQLQPGWLANSSWRWGYMLSAGLLSGLYAGAIMWLLVQMLRQTTPQLSTRMADLLADFLRITMGPAELLVLLAGNVFLAMLAALLHGAIFERLHRGEPGWIRSKRAQQARVAVTGLLTGGVTMVVVTLFGEPRIGLAWGLLEAIIFMTGARYVYGRSYRTEIRTVESLSLTWPSALQGAVIGLMLATLFELVGWFVYGEPEVTWTVAIPAVAGLLIGGLRGKRLEATSAPNQGIRLSLRNSLVAGVLSGAVLAALSWYLRQPLYALFAGLITFLITAALFGGSNVIKHYLVRILLWLHGDLPWDCVRLLDHGAALVFLRKVGGGYMFIHPLFQRYFASLNGPGQMESGAPARRATAPKVVRLGGSSR